MQMIGWIAAALSVAGNGFVIKKNRSGYVFWFVANCYWVVHNWRAGEWALTTLFAVYAALAAAGWVLWRPSPKAGTVKRRAMWRHWQPWELN